MQSGNRIHQFFTAVYDGRVNDVKSFIEDRTNPIGVNTRAPQNEWLNYNIAGVDTTALMMAIYFRNNLHDALIDYLLSRPDIDLFYSRPYPGGKKSFDVFQQSMSDLVPDPFHGFPGGRSPKNFMKLVHAAVKQAIDENNIEKLIRAFIYVEKHKKFLTASQYAELIALEEKTRIKLLLNAKGKERDVILVLKLLKQKYEATKKVSFLLEYEKLLKSVRPELKQSIHERLAAMSVPELNTEDQRQLEEILRDEKLGKIPEKPQAIALSEKEQSHAAALQIAIRVQLESNDLEVQATLAENYFRLAILCEKSHPQQSHALINEAIKLEYIPAMLHRAEQYYFGLDYDEKSTQQLPKVSRAVDVYILAFSHIISQVKKPSELIKHLSDIKSKFEILSFACDEKENELMKKTITAIDAIVTPAQPSAAVPTTSATVVVPTAAAMTTISARHKTVVMTAAAAVDSKKDVKTDFSPITFSVLPVRDLNSLVAAPTKIKALHRLKIEAQVKDDTVRKLDKEKIKNSYLAAVQYERIFRSIRPDLKTESDARLLKLFQTASDEVRIQIAVTLENKFEKVSDKKAEVKELTGTAKQEAATLEAVIAVQVRSDKADVREKLPDNYLRLADLHQKVNPKKAQTCIENAEKLKHIPAMVRLGESYACEETPNVHRVVVTYQTAIAEMELKNNYEQLDDAETKLRELYNVLNQKEIAACEQFLKEIHKTKLAKEKARLSTLKVSDTLTSQAIGDEWFHYSIICRAHQSEDPEHYEEVAFDALMKACEYDSVPAYDALIHCFTPPEVKSSKKDQDDPSSKLLNEFFDKASDSEKNKIFRPYYDLFSQSNPDQKKSDEQNSYTLMNDNEAKNTPWSKLTKQQKQYVALVGTSEAIKFYSQKRPVLSLTRWFYRDWLSTGKIDSNADVVKLCKKLFLQLCQNEKNNKIKRSLKLSTTFTMTALPSFAMPTAAAATAATATAATATATTATTATSVTIPTMDRISAASANPNPRNDSKDDNLTASLLFLSK